MRLEEYIPSVITCILYFGQVSCGAGVARLEGKMES